MADKHANYYLGLMSGTSVDSIDAALVDFNDVKPRIVATYAYPMPGELRERILSLFEPGASEIDRMGSLDRTLGEHFADAANTLLTNSDIPSSAVVAIGSHGQTIRHRPSAEGEITAPFTLQIGDPNIIAARTGITTIADFRRRDMAEGGQGAPLAPALHNALFRADEFNRCIVNIGGMSNITLLPSDPLSDPLGYDTGPGNCLMDAWIYRHRQQKYDLDGQWAHSGEVNKTLLDSLLAHPYFAAKPPKSTGREEFNLAWLDKILSTFADEVRAENVQASLAELTARSIAEGILNALWPIDEVYLCGGGAYNTELKVRLSNALRGKTLNTTQALGVAPEWVEAVAFAWLAMRRMKELTGNLPAVTGARKMTRLGAIFPP